MMAAGSDTPSPADVRPVVSTGSTAGLVMFYGGLFFLSVFGTLIVYTGLSASDEAADAPATGFPPEGTGGPVIASPPPLATPARFAQPAVEPAEPELPGDTPLPAFTARIVEEPPLPPIQRPPTTGAIPPPVPQSREPTGPQVVFGGTVRRESAPALRSSERGERSDRVTAARLENPSHTVPQGTVIPAVLETALDSTRPGGVRALVQRDVLSFDGTRVLIPRGSRLYGEYEANLQSGQNRALVQWTRLIRPDGVTIALDSPSSDPLGRAGIGGRVDTKFLQRFGGAILQSVLDIGVGLAVNEASDGVIVALPGSTQNLQVNQPQQIQPTLKVRHGTSVSVFVARDLDFSSVDP